LDQAAAERQALAARKENTKTLIQAGGLRRSAKVFHVFAAAFHRSLQAGSPALQVRSALGTFRPKAHGFMDAARLPSARFWEHALSSDAQPAQASAE
jgi:hypothetical protein